MIASRPVVIRSRAPFILVAAAVLLFSAAPSWGSQCARKAPPVGMPGADTPDDNLSNANPSMLFRVEPPSVLIPETGAFSSAFAFLTRVGMAPVVLSDERVYSQGPVWLVPTGALGGWSHAEQARAAFVEHLESGGSLVVLAQQRSWDYEVLPTPSGEPIRGWGWFEDNSCWWNAAYVETFHPILASQKTPLVTAALDGFFDSIPAESIVLLRRTKNSMPAMFMYPYGQGWVIVSSSYDDWGGYNQSGSAARAIIRDAIAWAEKPADLPIHLPGSSASLDLTVRNPGPVAAAQVKLLLMSPSRDRVMSEQTVPAAVPAGGSIEVPFSHAFLANTELGIYHIDYQLLDAAGETLQPVLEDDSGRIVVAQPPDTNSYRPPYIQTTILMPDGEETLLDYPTRFSYRISNSSDSPKRLHTYWEINHGVPQFLEELTLAAHETVERELVTSPTATLGRFWLHAFEENGPPRFQGAFSHVPGEPWPFALSSGKGFHAHLIKAKLTVPRDLVVRSPGEVVDVPVTVQNFEAVPWSGLLRLTGRDGVSVEQSLTLAASATWQGTLSVTIPTTRPRSDDLFDVALLVGTRVLDRAGWSVKVAAPDPRSVSLSQPTWSRDSGNVVSWTIENPAAVPVTAGTLRAELRDGLGAIVWESDQPLVLAPHETQTFTWTVPALGPDYRVGRLVLQAGSGFQGGRPAVESKPVVARLTGVPGAIPILDAGQASTVALSLRNDGTAHETGTVSGAIEGFGAFSPQAIDLLPGATADLSFPFTVPADARGGPHSGYVDVPGSGRLSFAVVVRHSRVEIELPPGPFAAGQAVQTTFRNTGGARTTQDVLVRLTHQTVPAPPVEFSASITLAPGQELDVPVALPGQIAAGTYLLSASAAAQESGAFVRSERPVSISGTSASLTVAMDQEIYAQGAPSLATVTLTNGPDAPLDGLLRVEVAGPCDTGGGPELRTPRRQARSAAAAGVHVSVWDGVDWVEKAIRGFGPSFDWDVVDLAGVSPPGATELRVRLTHDGSEYGRLDYVALMSAGALHEPTEALYGSTSVLPWLVSVDESFITLAGDEITLRFAPVEAPALVLRAAEGTAACPTWVEWQRTWPVSLTPNALDLHPVATVAPWIDGEYIARAYVLNRDGVRLVEATDRFLVVSSGITVTTDAPPTLVRGSQGMTFSGLVSNVGLADEPDLVLRVSIQRDSYGSDDVLYEPFGLSPGADHPFAATFTPADFGVGEAELNLVARVERASDPSYPLARSSAVVRAGEPSVQAELVAPTPMVKLVATAVATVDAGAGDMDAVMGPGLEDLAGSLPFPVTLGGQVYDRFRQNALGFVELVPVGAPGATGAAGICLGDLDNPQGAMLAGLLAFYDPSLAGFIGHKLYGAGETDGAGREFPSDTLVFFWHAPVAGGGASEINRVQLVLARDGLLRADVVAPFASLPCGQSTGVVAPPSVLPAPPGLGLTFALRLETGVGREPFGAQVRLTNAGTFPGGVTVDHGPEGGPRQVEVVTVPAQGAHALSFSGQIAQDTTYTALLTGDLDTMLARTVAVSEGLLVRYGGPEAFEPGPARLPVRVTKLGGVAGPVTVTFRLTAGSASQTLIRTYDLEPGFWFDDALDFDLPDGSAELTAEATGLSLTWEGPGPLLIAPVTRVAMNVTPGPVSGGVWPLAVEVSNTGLEDFDGEVQAIGPSGPRAAVLVAGGDTTTASLDINLAAATPGPNAYTVRLVDSTGNVVREEVVNVDVLPAQLGVVATPDGQSFPSGAWRDLVFRLRNTGHQRGAASLWMTVFDEEREQQLDLAPGAELDVTFRVYVDDDVEAKTYVLRYGLDLPGQPRLEQEARIQVEGIQLTVNATLDQPAYAPGDTAHFSVAIQNDSTGLGAEYLVRVHYADFDETRTVVVDPAGNETFDIPLPAVTGEPVFLGITHPHGRSLYINTYHLWAADPAIRVTLDASVYAPGATVGVQIVPTVAGSLTLTGPGYSETIEVTGPTSRTFDLAGDLPGGTQFVSWSFTPTASGAGAAGQVPFDVSGLRVRVFEARLGQGRYETGDSMTARLLINTNRPASVTLRGFLVDPEGGSEFLGEVPLGLDPQADLLDIRSWPMASMVAGLHRFTYGIYQGESLLASGSVAFDVGPAAVLGVRTDKFAYPDPAETVQATVVLFVSSPATLELDVDDQQAATRELAQSGIVEIQIPLTGGVSPGRHDLVARAVGGGYTSERRTPFEYGTSLPDLVVSPAVGRAVTPAGEWQLGVSVSNAGPTDAAATTVTLTEAGVPVGSATVPALAAGGSSDLQVDWDVLGAAGSHEIQAKVDPSGVVTEFSEDNNFSIATVEVPNLAMGVAPSAPSYPANVEATFTLSVTNLTAGSSYSGITGTVSITRPDGAVFALPAVGLPEVGPLGSVTGAAPWVVGPSAPGAYGVSAELTDSGGAVVARGLTSFQVTPTIALGGTVSATPNPVGVGEPLALQGHLESSGNVAADGTATFELVASDQTIAASFGTPASVPLGGGTDVSVDVPALDVPPADYSLRLGLDVAGVPYPAATSTLTVSGESVHGALALDTSPRVLVFVDGEHVDPAGWARRAAFVAESVQGLRVTTTGDLYEFGRQARSGTWNTYVVVGSYSWPALKLTAELREAVHRGDGLVVAQWSAGDTGRLAPALGTHVRGALPPGAHTVVLADSPLGPPQTLQLSGPFARLELAGAAQVGTLDGARPAVTTNAFGLGRAVMFAFDPAVEPSDPERSKLRQLFAAAVAYAAPASGRAARASVVVPLSFSVSNPAGPGVSVELTAVIPAGLTAAAVDDSPTLTDPPTWAFTLAVQETRTARFSVAVPDGAGTYPVSSTLRLNGIAAQAPPALTLEVATGMAERLADLVTSLKGTTVSPRDRGKLISAIALLEAAAVVPPAPPASDELKVMLAGLATDHLGQISSGDVSGPWLEVDYLMAGWARAWFTATSAPIQGTRKTGTGANDVAQRSRPGSGDTGVARAARIAQAGQ